jgi:D-tyrosyl-tRNA(Tyr) deacylase
MKAVVTRVTSATVTIDGAVNGQIGRGYLVLLGVGPEDTEQTAEKLAEKICNLRIFEDENGKMNLNLEKAGRNEVLVISQFTLFADCRSRRPAFIRAARPDTAIPLYERVIEGLRAHSLHVETGVFGADMQVISQNDGPVTILLDTDEL